MGKTNWLLEQILRAAHDGKEVTVFNPLLAPAYVHAGMGLPILPLPPLACPTGQHEGDALPCYCPPADGWAGEPPAGYEPPDVDAHPDGCPECGCSWDDHDGGGFCSGPCHGNRCHGRQFIHRAGEVPPERVTLEGCVCGEHFDCPDGWHYGADVPCLCTPDCVLDDGCE